MEIIGHQTQWTFLRKSAKLGRIPNAFLFSGPSQLGKLTLVLELAKLLNCQQERFEDRPCQNCQNCKTIDKKTHPDFILIQPAPRVIQIGQIRDIFSKFSLKSHSAPYKIAVIDQAHRMSQEVQTSLLKNLEEPKGNTLFVLSTPYPETLLSTIISRCEKIKFFPVPKEEIKNSLLKKGIPEKKAEEISILSFGKPGRAMNLIQDNLKLKREKERIEEIEKLIRSDFSSRFRYVKNLSRETPDLNKILEIWLRYFREIFLLKIEGGAVLNPKSSASHYSLEKLKNILNNIQKIIFLNSTTNTNPKLALELLMIEL